MNQALYIRQGVLVDSDGALAVALLAIHPFIVPFSVVSIHDLSQTIPPCQLLAAINGNIVGITQPPPSPFCSGERRRFKCERIDDSNEDHDEFELNIIQKCDSSFSNCVSLAIVRCIDLTEKLFVLITPISSNHKLLNSTEGKSSIIWQLQKGTERIQVPRMLLYSPGLPCFTYLSSESTGEGSERVHTRSNVKRKSHG
jgi:hypothetical protein